MGGIRICAGGTITKIPLVSYYLGTAVAGSGFTELYFTGIFNAIGESSGNITYALIGIGKWGDGDIVDLHFGLRGITLGCRGTGLGYTTPERIDPQLRIVVGRCIYKAYRGPAVVAVIGGKV